jgi:hypothetical protein
MAIQQREHKLNKRMAIFEQLMDFQVGLLNFKYHPDIRRKVAGLQVANFARTQAYIISSQVIPNFPKGGSF